MSIVSRVAARYKKKLVSDEGNPIYQYSERQVALRNSKKAERLEKLRKSVHKLRSQVKKDLKSGDPESILTALVVGLMDHTAERVGNDDSADDGHFGVTGWKKKHVSFGEGKATIKYVGKSGVKQEKVVSDKSLVAALKKAHEGCKGDDIFCHDEVKITATKINAYLEQFDISAKDLRGLHANVKVREALKRVRSEGGELPSDPKKRKTKLKAEFDKAIEETAAAVGHEAKTLASHYLTPGTEEDFLKDGTVMSKMVKAVALGYWVNRKEPDVR